MKTIKYLINSRSRPHWVGDGFNVFPLFNELAFQKELSPFLMFDYAPPKSFPPTTKRLGVGMHPHRYIYTLSHITLSLYIYIYIYLQRFRDGDDCFERRSGTPGQ